MRIFHPHVLKFSSGLPTSTFQLVAVEAGCWLGLAYQQHGVKLADLSPKAKTPRDAALHQSTFPSRCQKIWEFGSVFMSSTADYLHALRY